MEPVTSMRKSLSSFVIILGTSFLLMCSTDAWGSDKDIDHGRMKDSVYTNSFFGISVIIPNGWYIRNKEALDSTVGKGKTNDCSGKLVAAFKYEKDTVPLNPSFLMMVEKLEVSSSITSTKYYILKLRGLLDKMGLGYEFDDSIGTEEISGRTFTILHARRGDDSFAIYQNYYCTLIKGYSLNFIQTYSDEEQHAELEHITSTMYFKKEE